MTNSPTTAAPQSAVDESNDATDPHGRTLCFDAASGGHPHEVEMFDVAASTRVDVEAAESVARPPTGAASDAASSTQPQTLATRVADVIAPTDRFRGPPGLLPGESLVDFENLYRELKRHLKPGDVIEELWIRDIADHSWEVLRYRRFLIALNSVRLCETLATRLAPAIPDAAARDKLLRDFATGDRAAISAVDAALKALGLDWHAINALVSVEQSEEFEKIERMRQLAENQRDALIRELDRRREYFHVRRGQHRLRIVEE
jgi:hypothetical protein